MKNFSIKNIYTGIAFCFCMLFISVPEKTSAQLGVSISYQTFYDDLSPYGSWFNDGQYGYVWQPAMGNGFRPYFSDGYWAMTEYGSTWVSNYSWGWAPFHYGRWVYDSFYGWVWIPGREWGPAWVNWRHGGGYYGWTPMGPGYGPGEWWGYNPPQDQWYFVSQNYVMSPAWHNHYYGPHNQNIFYNTTVIENTYVTNNTTYIIGPRASEIEKETKVKVPVYTTASNPQSGKSVVKGNTVSVYRPAVTDEKNSTDKKPAPSKFETAKQPIMQQKQTEPQTEQKQTTPNQTTPKQTAPNEKVKPDSKEVSPKQTAPQQTAPKQKAPNQTTPKQTAPQQNAPPTDVQKQQPQKQKQPQQQQQKNQQPKSKGTKPQVTKKTNPK